MKYKVNTDDNKYLKSFEHTGTEEDTIELQPVNMDLQHLDCYHLVDDVCILDEGKLALEKQDEATAQEIATLKKELTDTDYLVSRCFEEVMSLENPLTFIADTIAILKKYKEKYAETITNRKAWRERVEELEG